MQDCVQKLNLSAALTATDKMRKHWGFLTAHMITELTWGIITILQCPSESFEEMESNANFKAFYGRLGKTL